MPWPERTVKCPECKAERTTRAGKGTKLGCAACGVKFPAPAVEAATKPPASGKGGPRVKRAKASTTVVRQNARPRPKKTSPTAGDGGKPPAEETPPPTQQQDPPPPAPDPASSGDDEGRRRQRAAGRRGGLAYYTRHLRKAS